MRNVLSGTKDTIADTLRNGYLNGPGIQMRSFYRWADNPDHFGSIGMPSGKMEVLGDVDTTAIAAHISSPPGTSVWVQNARAGLRRSVDVGQALDLCQPTPMTLMVTGKSITTPRPRS